MYYQSSPGRADNKTMNNGGGQMQQQATFYQQYAAFSYQQQHVISTPLDFQQRSPTKCIKNSVVNRQMMKHQRSPYYSKEHLHHLTAHKHQNESSNYFSNLSSPSSSMLSTSRYMVDSGIQMSYSTSSPDISKNIMSQGYDGNITGSGLSTSSSSALSESNMMCNPPTTPVSTSSSNNSHTSAETPPLASTTFQQRVEYRRQDTLSIPSSSTSSVSGREQPKLFVTPATNTSPSTNSEAKSSTNGITSMANTCSTSVKSSLDSSYDDLKPESSGGSGFVSSGSYSGVVTPGSYSDIPDSPTQMKPQFPPMPIPSHMTVPGYFHSPGGRLYAWQQPLDCSTLRFKQPTTSQPAPQIDDISYTTVDSSCSKSNDITLMERTLQMGNVSSNSNSQPQQQSLSRQNSWSFQTALSSQSANNTNQLVEQNDPDNESLKHYNDDDQSDTKSVHSNFSGFSVISDIARDQAQYASVDSDALDNMISFCRQKSASNSALPTPNLNRQQPPVLTSSANKPPWSMAPAMGSSIRSIFLNQDVNHTPPSKDVETEMPWRNSYMNVNRSLYFNQQANDDQDKDALRTYDRDDVDDAKSVAYSIPSIIQNEQEAIKSRPPIDVDNMLKNVKYGYNPVFESSNSMNWTTLQHHPNSAYPYNEHSNKDVPAPFLPKNDMDESMNNQSSLAENSTLDDDDEQMNEFIQQNYYDESSDEDDSEDDFDYGQTPFESAAPPSRALLPKIEEVQEEEDYSPKPIKKAARKNPPVIQMNKTALLRVNKMKEMAAANKNSAEPSGVRRTTSTSQNLAGVKENVTKITTTTSKIAGKTGNKINPIRRTVESSTQQQQVLANTNLHSSKFNKY